MKKNRIFMLGILAIVPVFSIILPGCGGNNGDKVPTKNVMITIANNSSDKITSYKVVTSAGLGSSEYNYGYTSIGFVEIPLTGEELVPDEYLTKSNTSAFSLAAGATSEKLGPFKVAFREDMANGSSVSIIIHLDGNTTNGFRWSTGQYFEEEIPANFDLNFNGSKLSEIK